MKIRKNNQNMKMFENLQEGDVFIHRGEYFMKINGINDASPACNAVCLNDGVLAFIGLIEFVDKIDGEFVINE